MTDSLPFLSVVVPAYNRPEGLEALIEALTEQSYPPYRFEVIVCDDGSEPPLASRVEAKGLPFQLRFSREANAGPATARNRGIREAGGAIVAFTDDDCLPSPGWLEAIAEAFENPEVYAVHGPTRSSVPPIEPFIHSIHIEREHGVATANFAVRKEALQAVGGFDTTFRVPYFEDEDLSRRLQAAFGPIHWADAMRVTHPPRPAKFLGLFRRAAYSYYLPYMQAKYPGYWKDAMPAVRKRVIAKGALVLIGCLPLFGAPVSFALGWAALLVWQGQRLRRILHEALTYQVRLPLIDQLLFLTLEWAADFVRLYSYQRGKALPHAAKAEPDA